jgi:hypothetical protein
MRSVDIDGPCLSLCALQVQAYVNVSASEAALQMAVATAGPVAVAIDASHPEFLFYSSGVFYLAECKNDANDLDHGIALLQSPPPPLNSNPNASHGCRGAGRGLRYRERPGLLARQEVRLLLTSCALMTTCLTNRPHNYNS